MEGTALTLLRTGNPAKEHVRVENYGKPSKQADSRSNRRKRAETKRCPSAAHRLRGASKINPASIVAHLAPLHRLIEYFFPGSGRLLANRPPLSATNVAEQSPPGNLIIPPRIIRFSRLVAHYPPPHRGGKKAPRLGNSLLERGWRTP